MASSLVSPKRGTKLVVEDKAVVEAVLKRWPIPDDALTDVVKRLHAIVRREDIGPRWQIQAAKALAILQGQNIRVELAERQLEAGSDPMILIELARQQAIQADAGPNALPSPE